MQTVVQALSEPRRREILRLVRSRELAAGEIAAHFEVTRPTISQHLTLLKNAGLITERRDGTRRLYALRPAALAELDRWLDRYRRFWGARLDDLAGHLDAKTSGERAEEATWEDDPLRCLHVCFLARSTGERDPERRQNLNESGAFDRSAVAVLKRRVRPYAPPPKVAELHRSGTTWKHAYYTRGERVTVDASPFLDAG